MPELPEVEVVRRGLERHVVGATIDGVRIDDVRSIRRHLAGTADFADQLTGQTVMSAQRRGKYLWLPLDSDDALLIHLGMSGQVLIQSPDAPALRHERITFDLSNALQVRFVDQRIFGGMSVSASGAELPAEVAHIARDLFDPLFDADEFAHKLKNRKTGLKRALLDQSLISGIGNIYADEALWRAKLHFARATQTMRRPDIDRFLAAAQEVMSEALCQGGTSFDALYVNVNGQSGYFERSLEAYGRHDEPCRRCGTLIRRDVFMNRSSFWCPRCQPRPRNPQGW